MGLDMYLTAELYVSGWEHSRDPRFEALSALLGVTPDSGSPWFTVNVCVGYWRKANAIHRWFVQHVQQGKDDCRSYAVSREQLAELRAQCQRVLDSIETVPGRVRTGTTYCPGGRVVEHTQPGEVVAQPGLAAALLPTQEGFFFGSTDYDEYYLQDLRDTVEIVDRVLAAAELEGWDFEYRASW